MCDISISVKDGTAVLSQPVSVWNCHTCDYMTTSFVELQGHVRAEHNRLPTQEEGYSGPGLRRLVVKGDVLTKW